MLRTLLARIRGSFDRDRLDDEFDEEARAHLELLARRFVERGLTPEEAAYAARRQFGRVTRVREDLRARRGLPGIDALAGDLRHAFRQLRRSPGFAVMAAGTLALGIGATTAVFALLDAVVLRPLPYADAGRLMAFRSLDRRGTPHPTVLDYPTFFDFRAETSVFERLVSYRSARFTLADAPPAIQVPGQIVSRDLFELLGVPLALGRGFLPEEERPGVHVAVIDHRLWQSRFGADPGLVGRRVRMNGQPYTVVGVTPLGFRFPLDSPSSQIWAPLSEDATTLGSQPLTEQRGARVLDVIGRLRPGVSPEQAQAKMDQVAEGLAERYPDSNRNVAKTLVLPEVERLAGRSRPALLVLLGAVSLVLLIACANVANLLLARTTERGREFALRLAVGASRAAVVRQLATEGLAIGLLGAAGGLALAWAVLAAVVPFVAEEVPRVADAGLDARVVGFAAALAVLTSVLFSLAPAAKAARAAPSGALKEGGRGVAEGRSRARSVLVVAQVTLGLVLLVGAELLVGSFVRLVQRDPGFRSENLLTFDVGQPASGDATLFAERLLERLRALPGVRAAAVGTPLPLSGSQMSVAFDIEERRAAAPDRPHSDMAIVTPGFFATMGIPLVRGRDFSERDTVEAPRVLVVNEAFAKKYFPDGDALGKRIEPGATNGKEGPQLREIVGIVGNAKQTPLRAESDPIYYFPLRQLSWGIGEIVVRTDVPPRQLEPLAKRALSDLDPEVPMYDVHSGEERAAQAVALPRFLMLLMGGFALTALLLTAVGLFGVLSYSVARRRQEIGVRIALGAARGDVIGLVFREAFTLVIAGLLLGLTCAAATTRLLAGVLFQVEPRSPVAMAVASGVLLAAGVAAAYLPAARAASVEPMQALRAEGP